MPGRLRAAIEDVLPDRETGPVAITGARILTMDGPDSISGTVVTEGGRIVAVGDAAVPTEARVIDAGGRTLLPGLADMHIHWHSIDEAALLLSSGITTVRNMWGGPYHLALRALTERGEIPGPHLITTGPLVDGRREDGTLEWPYSLPLDEPERAAQLVEAVATRGYDEFKAYSELTPETLAALGEACRAQGIPMVGHCPDRMTFEEAVAAGMSSFEHLHGVGRGHLTSDEPEPWDRAATNVIDAIATSLDLDAIRDLARHMAAEGVWNCPTLVVFDQFGQEPEEALSDPLVKLWPPSARPMLEGFARARAPEWRDAVRRRNPVLRQVVRILHEEGAPLLIGTDAPNPFVTAGHALHQELANFVECGLSPYEAIRCATVDASRFAGQEEVWGRVRPGHRADVLLVDGDPLDDLAVLREPYLVLVNGFILERGHLEAMVAARTRAHRRGIAGMAADSAAPGKSPDRSGTLVATVGRTETMRVDYAEWSGDGVVEIVEQHAGEVEHWLNGVRSSRVTITPDGRLLSADVEVVTDVGAATTVVAVDGDVCRVTSVDLDGTRTVHEVAAPVLAGSQISLLAIERWLGTDPAPVLSFEVTGPTLELPEVDQHDRRATMDRMGTPVTVGFPPGEDLVIELDDRTLG